MKIPVGRAGSWFANWEGEQIPCIHKHALKGSTYIDDGVNEHPAWPSFIGALREQRRAILTTSHLPDESGIRRRKSYIGIWEIADVQVSNGVMKFELGGLLHRF